LVRVSAKGEFTFGFRPLSDIRCLRFVAAKPPLARPLASANLAADPPPRNAASGVRMRCSKPDMAACAVDADASLTCDADVRLTLLIAARCKHPSG
jgi:hypothetical protein